jgi:AcrR family transcriptional regulator
MTGSRAATRARIEADIIRIGRRQLAEVGAAALSLREVARELGMVSSAVYRYVESRDDLLTQLIIAAYDSLGEAAEAASERASDAGDLSRWVAVGDAIRTWALERPHEYLLLYGTPVPGYAAPDDTVSPGTRVSLALVGVVHDAARAGRLDDVAPFVSPVPAALAHDLGELSRLIDVDDDPARLAAVLFGWTQLFGHLSFELTSQTRGMVGDHGEFFRHAVTSSGRAIGLR